MAFNVMQSPQMWCSLAEMRLSTFVGHSISAIASLLRLGRIGAAEVHVGVDVRIFISGAVKGCHRVMAGSIFISTS